jgi:uncharacterized protein YjbI with pentapeptide repeats
MNKYVRKLFDVIFQSQQAQQVVRASLQSLPTSPEEWYEYWQAKGLPWRTEAEIDVKRQEELSKRRAIVPDIEKGIYPFKEMKLSRADVEWLLATHENGRGRVDWSDESQREREGLDVRGADLRGTDLSSLPLACLRGGLKRQEWRNATDEQRALAVVRLQGANLREARLQEANLREARLQEANLREAQLQRANLREGRLQGAILNRAQLQDADLRGAQLQGVDLFQAHLEQADLRGARFDGADIEEAVFSDEKQHIGPWLSDVQWGMTNLTNVKWSAVAVLSEEINARKKMQNGTVKNEEIRLREYEEAVRANRQLAVALQAQGLNEDAARFAYRAQILQRKVLWKQRDFGKWLFSMLLALVTGYGYRMWRILVAYLFIVLLCAVAYFVLGMYYEPHLSFLEAVLTSITAFHGRVFSESFLRPDEPQLWVTAFEAIAGLVIEGMFIAMLTQKFFGK